ncbi:glycine zipper domain-containing protein [Klebsiella pneumoniae]|uniref:glycine zipper domain-containing protein n=1 Tax=Klebsiella pneumoniae TaxID=573 RepID=UPI003D920A68
MANHVNRNNFDENAEDIHNDVSQLADTPVILVSKKRKRKAQQKKKNTMQQAALDARQAACDALGCADTYVRNKPWHSVGAAAAVGVFIGVLLNLRR